MRRGGLEPPSLSAPDPKSGVSANSTTSACLTENEQRLILSPFIYRVTQRRIKGSSHHQSIAAVLRFGWG